MRKLGPERIPAAAGVFAAASVCIAADSVFMGIFIEIAVVSAFDGSAGRGRIVTVAATTTIGG